MALSETKKIKEAVVALTVNGRFMRAAVYLSHSEGRFTVAASNDALPADETVDLVRRRRPFLEIPDRFRFTGRLLDNLIEEFMMLFGCLRTLKQ